MIQTNNSDIRLFRDEYEFLSNFYPCRIEYCGIYYQNAEAAFQAQKCRSEEEKLGFCGLLAAKAKRRGRQILPRPDQENVKLGVMEEIVRAKFIQNPKLAKKLISTGERRLVEGNTWGDTFWGVDAETVQGANHLGRILMQLRSDLCSGS